MPSAPTDIVGPFEIAEMTGEKRTIVLKGRALPYRPFTLTGTQRLETFWYPGNPVATAQVLGAAEDATAVNGIWKDRFIADISTSDEGNVTVAAQLDGAQLPSTKDLVDAVDDFRRKGQILTVSWHHVKRRGFITKFTQTWHNLHDCEWEIEFTWTANAIDGDARINTKEIDLKGVTDQTVGKFVDIYNATTDAISKLEGIADSINDKVGVIQGAVTEMEDNFVNMVDGALSPIEASRRAVATLESVGADASATIDITYSRVYQSLVAPFDASNGTQDISSVLVGEAVGAANGRAKIVRQSRKMKHDAARNRARLIRSIDPELTRTFFARDGQDLRDVSIQFFGTADNWQKIAEFNRVSTSKLRAGQVILVPESFSGERGC